MPDLLVGVDLGGTNLKAGVVTTAGEIIARDRAKTLSEEGPRAVVKRMSDLSRTVASKAGAKMDDVIAVGVGSPGPLSALRGVVIFTPNLPGWTDIPVAQWMREDLDRPVFLENDANSACWGEFWLGAGREVTSMIIVTLGTGLGGGIVHEGKLMRGSTESAGHIGHVIVEPGGRPCGCGGRGCVEQYASATAVARNAREHLAAGEHSRFLTKPPDQITARDVAEAAEKGCTLCNDILTQAGRYLGMALADMANVINPDLAVIGGGMANAGERLLAPVRDQVHDHALEVAAEHMRIEPAALGEDAGFVGAAGLAFERIQAGES